MAIMKVYDKNGCVGCPPEMGCLGAMCPECWEYKLICDKCDNEVDEIYRDENGTYYCEECLMSMFTKISYDDDDLEKYVCG